MTETEVAADGSASSQQPGKSIGGEKPYPSQIYAWYVVGVLVIAYTFSFIDRQILSLLVGPMKRDLSISDFEMSLLQGFAFAIFYAVLGLPIGRMVDSKKRVTIISVGILVWSAMTALCGTARSYWELFLYRMGVGVGEAALSPAAYSMLADYFKPERMGFALGVYGMGVYIGAGLALVIGAQVIAIVNTTGATTLPVIGEIYPWQIVFLAVGLPGILVAIWMWTIKEPERRGHMRTETNEDGEETHAPLPLSEVVGFMWQNRATLVSHHLCYALGAMMAYGVAAWIPTFLVRTHGWGIVDAGTYYGIVVMIFGTAGVVAGGWMGDKVTASGRPNGRLLVMGLGCLAAAPFALAYPLVDNIGLVFVLLCFATFFSTFAISPGAAAIQELMPNQMRGFASAFMIFVITLIGLGLGPSVIAAMTDFVYQDEMMIRYSLAYPPSLILLAGGLIGLAGLKPYLVSRERVIAWSQQHEA
jgi:MFS family permease